MKFFPLSTETRLSAVQISILAGSSRWSQISGALGHALGRDPLELHSTDCYFGPDDDSVDVLVHRGSILGSFDRELTADEWHALVTNPENVVRTLNLGVW